MLIQVIGGLGLFLLGMVVMTEGLRSLAGDTMRAALVKFTHSPVSGAMTGTTITALLQSSSVTTVASVGFVGAGLLTFPEALGIIFGANLGTTVTGWLVALLGFKLKLGTVVLPVILIGVILRLFARGRVAMTGYAIAGFGLIFVGISTMQSGVVGLEGIISPNDLPSDTLVGRLQLVLMGAIFTIITQSSSAGVATALTALYANAINFHQAAALVIGMDVGTTVKAAIASLGGSVAMRRTGLSHGIYNCFTAIGALILITPFVLVWEYLASAPIIDNAQIALVAFHSTFNVIGITIVIPFTYQFASFIERVIPDTGPGYGKRLEPSLLGEPDLALAPVQSSLEAQFKTLLLHVNAILGESLAGERADLRRLQIALDDTTNYIDRIKAPNTESNTWVRLLAMIHAMDHLQRLHERCEEEEDRATTAKRSPQLKGQCQALIHCIKQILAIENQQAWVESEQLAKATSKQINKTVKQFRKDIMARIASGEVDVDVGTDYLESIRWLSRVSQHIARITHHFKKAYAQLGIETQENHAL